MLFLWKQRLLVSSTIAQKVKVPQQPLFSLHYYNLWWTIQFIMCDLFREYLSQKPIAKISWLPKQEVKHQVEGTTKAVSLVPLILKITTGKEVSCSKDWWFHKKMKLKKKQTWFDYNSLILKQSTGKKLQSLFCQENFKSIAWSPQGIQMWRSSARNSQMSKTFDSFIGESVKN